MCTHTVLSLHVINTEIRFRDTILKMRVYIAFKFTLFSAYVTIIR